jgi:hypothetical protein
VESVGVGSYRQGASRLPERLTVAVGTESGKGGFYAEVDAVAAITPGRKLGSVKFSLACLTTLSIGQREASWKDVCLGDPKAIKSPNSGNTHLSRFDIGADGKSQESPPQKPFCGFPGLKLPANVSVIAAGAYSGRKISYQIDQSGHEGTQIDVTINNPDKPVVLMLGAYEPTIWNVSWSRTTKILAVLIGGYHRQAVAGLDKSTPLLVSSYDNKGPCGFFYVTPDDQASLNPLSQQVFGRTVDSVYYAINGVVEVGKPMGGVAPIQSADTTPESFYDKNAPIAGPAGLEAAVRIGLLRKATLADAEAWDEALTKNSPQRSVPTVAGDVVPKAPTRPFFNGYVVLQPFTYPSGLFGGHSAQFLIPRGVPKPSGDPGHSAVYDFNSLVCQGALCSAR